jgi:hypothetical protein
MIPALEKIEVIPQTRELKTYCKSTLFNTAFMLVGSGIWRDSNT